MLVILQIHSFFQGRSPPRTPFPPQKKFTDPFLARSSLEIFLYSQQNQEYLFNVK